jgi:hypothetical protein
MPAPATPTPTAPATSRTKITAHEIVNREFDRAQLAQRMGALPSESVVLATDYKLVLGADVHGQAARAHALASLRRDPSGMRPSNTEAAHAMAARMGLQREGVGIANTSARLVLG